ncbi:nucleotidyltransferase domain-containing protein [Fontimonas sp. SYSU GA230001]|uniref:nucleotidyltransferase domain-containing protein n=1 Tax=Fontimonas sp. SYSU GA230001 TaxID=3142450 RepID=UPI0032B4649E
MYVELSTTAQTGYAQLLDAVTARELHRTAAALAGSFSSKRIDGRTYWYYSYRLPGAGVQQSFVGPDSGRLRTLIAEAKAPQPDNTRDLVRSYLALGGSAAPPQQVSLLKHLADAGFFRAGGVLIGTHAFLSYANVLGVRWDGGDQTTDVDLGWTERHLSIAVPASPKVDLHDALSTFESGFVPTAIIGKGLGAAYHSRKDPDFRVDFLTTLSKRGKGARHIEALNITAEALPFMEFSLEQPVQAVLFDTRGRTVLANVPPPARFAIHKLIVSDLRGIKFRAKITKDLGQAASVIAWCTAHDPESLADARAEAEKRGPSWRRSLKAGWAQLQRVHPAVAAAAAETLG